MTHGTSTKTAIVCGGREYADRNQLFTELDHLRQEHNITLIVYGGAKGADWLAAEWAHQRGLECRLYSADWEKYGRAAGPIRNRKMLSDGKPDLVIAFPGGRGTANMTRQAQAAGVPVIEVDPH